MTRNLNVDLNYTYMIKYEGNYEGEATNQPALAPGINSFPEIIDPNRSFAFGRLNGYQKHKLRLLTNYNLPTHFGNFGFGMVYRFDSGTPYSYLFRGYSLTPIQTAEDPGYAHPPASQNLYFGDRGSQLFPSQSRFDFAFNYDIPVFKTLSPWIKATVLNVFNTAYRTGFDTGIIPCDDPANQDQIHAGCTAFTKDAKGLPTTFGKGPSFGVARGITDYQQARQFQLAVGIRF